MEAIYLVYSSVHNNEMMNIVVIYNNSIEYKVLLQEKIGSEAREDLRQLIIKYNWPIQDRHEDDCSKKIFCATSAGSYGHNKENRLVQELVSGNMLFDRFGRVKEFRRKLIEKDQIRPFPNTIDAKLLVKLIASKLDN